MSATVATDCEHDWEDTGIMYPLLGAGYVHECQTLYCAECHRFYYQIVGERPSDSDLVEATNTLTLERLARDRQAWLAAHYPEQVEDEA